VYSGVLIDSDVHHNWVSDDELVSYLPRRWRDFARGNGREKPSLEPAIMSYPHPHGVNKRLDTYGPAGQRPGSHYETMRDQLLDPFNVERAILSYDIGGNAGLWNPYLAAEVVRAANDWSIDHWLSRRDPRLYGAVLIPMQVPDEAAREIRRVGTHPRMAEVLIVANALGRPFGHPIYDPIFRAASELGLPVAIHAGTDLLGAAHTAAGGVPANRLEFHTLAPQGIVHAVTSLIAHGTFEKFPDLKVLIVEIGVTWVPWLIWGLDAHYEILRAESPWVKQRPSEYFREHIRLTTQPLEISPEPDQLVELLQAFGGMEDILCFATDYPHWDADDPLYIAGKLPSSWHSKVFYENARVLYGWSDLPSQAPIAPQARPAVQA
jgi:uncharacterized protein